MNAMMLSGRGNSLLAILPILVAARASDGRCLRPPEATATSPCGGSRFAVSSFVDICGNFRRRRRRRCSTERPSPRSCDTVCQMGGTETRPNTAARREDGKEKPMEPEERGRRARKKRLRQLEYRRRLDRWTRRYGSLSALQATFGKGPPWGDLSPRQTRALYHALLPRALLALNEMGLMRPEELAPLAYEARLAAKEYARSRCVWTGRAGTALFDQYRSLRDKGRLVGPGASASMSWEEIWEKYEGRIVLEECEGELDEKEREKLKKKNGSDDLATRIYMRILEKSCATNAAFDSLFLKEDGMEDSNLASIAAQLDHDVREILLSPKERSEATKKEERAKKKQLKELRKEEKAKKKQLKALQKEEERRRKAEEKEKKKKKKKESGQCDEEGKEVVREDNISLDGGSTVASAEDGGGLNAHDNLRRIEALRILAGTRRRFRQLLG